MNNILKIALMSSALIILPSAFADTSSAKEKPSAEHAVISEKKDTSANQSSESIKTNSEKKLPESIEISLYESPDLKSKVTQNLPINTDLVAIYNKGDWVKVGNKANGDTGWINVAQYREAKQNFYKNYYHENFTSIFFNWTKDKNGKTMIEAYRNGKKLSNADAQKLYDQMREQEQHQWEAMQRFNHMIDQQFRDDFFNMPIMMPGIVVIEQPIKTSKQNDKEKK